MAEDSSELQSLKNRITELEQVARDYGILLQEVMSITYIFQRSVLIAARNHQIGTIPPDLREALDDVSKTTDDFQKRLDGAWAILTKQPSQ